MPFKVKIDRSLCIGAASCMAVAPDVFDLDTEGKAIIRKKDGSTTATEWVGIEETNGNADDVLLAAKSCPVDAIVVIEVDEDGRELRQVWPEITS